MEGLIPARFLARGILVRGVLLLGLLVLGATTAWAQENGDGDGVRVGPVNVPVTADRPAIMPAPIHEGRALLLDLEFAAAERIFESLLRTPGRAERAATTPIDATTVRLLARWHLALGPLIALLYFDDRSVVPQVMAHSDSLRDELDAARAQRGYTAEIRWLTAENELLRSFAWSKQEAYVRAALAANAAWLASDAPSAPGDAAWADTELQKIRGLLHMAVGAFPSTFRRFLRMLGYAGTVPQGVAELQDAAANAAYGRDESLLYLALLDAYGFESGVKGNDVTAALHAAYPQSPVLALMHGDMLLRKRLSNRMPDVLLPALERTEAQGRPMLYLVALLGDAYFRTNRPDQAIPYYERYLAEQPGPALKNLTRLHLGMARELTGDREGALEAYRQVDVSRQFEEEAASARIVKRLLAEPMSAHDRTLIRAQNLFNSEQEAASAALYRQLLMEPGLPARIRGASYYGLGRYYHEADKAGTSTDAADNAAEALVWYDRAIAEPGEPAAKWAPWSLFHSADLLSDTRPGETLRRLDLLDRYKPAFDYQSLLENRARLLRESIQ
jgi:tetratricopeptide (TPR) repeat protein